jgi:hypothetical protein
MLWLAGCREEIGEYDDLPVKFKRWNSHLFRCGSPRHHPLATFGNSWPSRSVQDGQCLRVVKQTCGIVDYANVTGKVREVVVECKRGRVCTKHPIVGAKVTQKLARCMGLCPPRSPRDTQ